MSKINGKGIASIKIWLMINFILLGFTLSCQTTGGEINTEKGVDVFEKVETLETVINRTQEENQGVEKPTEISQETTEPTEVPIQITEGLAEETAESTQMVFSTAVIQPINAENVVELFRIDAGAFFGAAWSLDGATFAVVTNTDISLYESHNMEEVASINTQDCYYGITFSPDSSRLACGSEGGDILVWDVENGQVLHILKGHNGDITKLAFSPDGDVLASGSHDTDVNLWDVENGQLLYTLTNHTSLVTGVVFSPDGTVFASGSWDGSVMIWDTENWNLVGALDEDKVPVSSLAFSPDGRRLAFGCMNGLTLLFDFADEFDAKVLEGESVSLMNWVNDLAFSPDGSILASGNSDKTVILWDVNSAERLNTLTNHTDSVVGLAFSPDGSKLSSWSWDETVRLWGIP